MLPGSVARDFNWLLPCFLAGRGPGLRQCDLAHSSSHSSPLFPRAGFMSLPAHTWPRLPKGGRGSFSFAQREQRYRDGLQDYDDYLSILELISYSK